MMNEAEKTVPLSAKAIDELPMPERIGRLRDAMLAEPRFVSIEQARIVTRVYQEHAGEPRILVRAQALAAALREMASRVAPPPTPPPALSSRRTRHRARSSTCCGAARAKRWTPSRAS